MCFSGAWMWVKSKGRAKQIIINLRSISEKKLKHYWGSAIYIVALHPKFQRGMIDKCTQNIAACNYTFYNTS